jgi:O-antigen/teichoic acid export membrane protein
MEELSVGRGTASLFLANILSLVASTLYFVILTNTIRSTVKVGIVTSLNILVWFFVLICLLAQPVVQGGSIPAPMALLKFVPKFLAKNERNAANEVFMVSLASSAIAGAVIAGVLASLPTLVISLLGGQGVLPEYVRLSAVDILVVSVSQVCLGAIFSLGDAKTGAIYIVIWSVCRAALASILLVFFGLVGVLIGWIGGDLVLFLIALRKTLRHFVGQVGTGHFSGKDFARYGLYTLLAALLGFIINQADRLIALWQRGLSGLAIYNVASIGSGVAGYAPSALVTVLLPALAALSASDRTRDIPAIIRSSTRYVSLLVIPIAFGLAGAMEIPLRMFGPDYVAGLLPAIILSVATGLTALSAVYAGALLAIGKLRWYTLGNVLGLITLFAVAGTLTPLVGLTGPALGRAGLMAVSTIVYAFATSKAGIFEIDWKGFIASIIGSAAMMFVIFTMLSLLHSFLLKIVFSPALLVIGLLVYIESLRVFRFVEVSDIDFICHLLPHRLHAFLPTLAWLFGLNYRNK